MINEQIERYRSSCPDKFEWKTTTSRKFKRDFASFLSNEKNSNRLFALEMGAAQGHTTGLLSIFCDKTVSIEIDHKNCKMIQSQNFPGVVVECFNLYTEEFDASMKKYEKEGFDIAIIDAVHEYNEVISDTKNAMRFGCKTFVYDDFGLIPEVKRAILQIISDFPPKNISYIGLQSGTVIPTTMNKLLTDWEGLILQY